MAKPQQERRGADTGPDKEQRPEPDDRERPSKGPRRVFEVDRSGTARSSDDGQRESPDH
ncbi:hypothetical protein GT204_09620 [Streptomyces sp. SID4919]|uniref:hypothetical protein n=1 Tax=unclassified Streptomyces TaxID=2593676 RepID=UPI000823E631|nr:MULTISPECIES: hypothetical protein [unclassified Streptomyces]MYY09156.1 hypothetical protein [Streptomyces sp. SID4919]SCK29358.1 hypothetical protein YW7DRAFT_02312 [Streptomyces sp. AmelKG-E11A]